MELAREYLGYTYKLLHKLRELFARQHLRSQRFRARRNKAWTHIQKKYFEPEITSAKMGKYWFLIHYRTRYHNLTEFISFFFVSIKTLSIKEVLESSLGSTPAFIIQNSKISKILLLVSDHSLSYCSLYIHTKS